MIAYAVAALGLAAVLLVYWTIRRVSPIEGQLSELRSELASYLEKEQQHTLHEEACFARLGAQLDRIQEETQLRLSDLILDVRNQGTDIRELVRGYVDSARAQSDRQLNEVVTALNSNTADINKAAGELSLEVGNLSSLSQRLADLYEALQAISARIIELSDLLTELPSQVSAQFAAVRPPVSGIRLDRRFLDRSEAEMVAAAASLAFLRPLAPYPGWQFDADWANPDFAFQLRKWFWQHFHDRQSQTPVVTNWHAGTRLHLYLGNDLSRQIYVGGCIDPNEFVFLDRILRPGMTFLDAGANEGIYSVFAAKRVGIEGLVWAFEPSRREVERLHSNLELNGLKAVIFPLALADCESHAPFRIAGYEHEGQNTLGSFIYEGIETAATETVQVMPLDEIVKQHSPARVDIIKVDVEGAELRLFRGAHSTLERYRPILLSEVSDDSLRLQGGSREELLEFLRARGYDLYLFDPQSGLPTLATAGSHSDNMVGIPRGMQLPEAVYSPWPECVGPTDIVSGYGR